MLAGSKQAEKSFDPQRIIPTCSENFSPYFLLSSTSFEKRCVATTQKLYHVTANPKRKENLQKNGLKRKERRTLVRDMTNSQEQTRRRTHTHKPNYLSTLPHCHKKVMEAKVMFPLKHMKRLLKKFYISCEKQMSL